ncbi:MAG: SDR family oxidoreductase [Campylobacterales bacterium]|nr:SDR family oxidoreductase [Campylobacterales bacterium]
MKVLLTGSTGYIGRRLKLILMEQNDIDIRLLVRNKSSISIKTSKNVEIVEGDTFDRELLRKSLKDIDVAYYLIHSLNKKNYKDLDKLSAQNFIDVASECGVKKIIYLGGLGVKNDMTSEHLLSRLETGEILSSNPNVQCIWIRAGVIIGSGSASFEIIRNLVEKLPVMTTPKWVETKAQPIAVDDILLYLKEALYLKYKDNLIVDIGSNQMSYKEMMLQTAKVLGLKRYLIPIPFLSINLSSYWLNLFTPVPFSVAKSLIEGLKSEVVVQNDNALKYFPSINPMSFKQAVEKVIDEIEKDQIISRWSDNGGDVWEYDHQNKINDAIFVDRKIVDINGIEATKVYNSFTSIGGENGWFDYGYLWEIRGFIDKVLGGVGLKRGRRSMCDLRLGDCLDFWKVVDLKKDERLLLYAQMQVPGEAWLEFKIENDKLIQSAYFYPKGVWGRVYWYLLVPIHYLIFRNMIKSIIKNIEK